jgi:thioredoxin-like negative regulator of GroEL
MFTRLAVGVALLFASTSARADRALSSVKLEEALKNAKALKKAVLVEFSTRWCSACREFEKGVLKKSQVERALTDIVFLRYDAEDSPGNDAAGAYRVSTYPTFLAVDSSGLERFRRTGGEVSDVQAFLDLIADTKALYEDEAQMRDRLKNNPSDVKAKLEAARWYAARKQTREAIKELDAISKLKGRSADKTEASRFVSRLRRIAQWKDELVKSSVKTIRADYTTATVDDLIIASIGSGLAERDVQALFKEVFKAHADSDELIPYLYVASLLVCRATRPLLRRI